MSPPLATTTLLPLALPAGVLGTLAFLMAALWVGSHRLCRTLPTHWVLPGFAVRCAVGVLTLVLTADTAGHVVSYATTWPLWAILVGGAILVEALISLYRLERRTLPRRVAITLSCLRVALLLGLVAMLCQPVLVLETTRKVQRHVAIILDDTASMHIPDAGMSPSEKLRLAEALGLPIAHRTCPFERSAERLRTVRERLQAQADLLVSLADTDPTTRVARIARRSGDIRQSLDEALKAVAAETNACFDAAAAAMLTGNQALHSSVNELAAKLVVEAVEPLKTAADAATTLAREADKVSERYDTLLAGVRRTILQLDDLSRRIEALAETIDEGVYRTLKDADRAAVDAATAGTRAGLARTLLSHPTRAAASQPPSSLIQRLDAAYGVRLYILGTTPAETRVSSWVTDAARTHAAEGTTPEPALRTDLAMALDAVRADMPPGETAGILLLSDGRHNTPSAIEPVVRSLGLQKIPVLPVVFGGTRQPPPDAAIASANAPEAVSTNDRVAVDIDLKLDGLAGSNVVVQLFDGDRLAGSNTVVAAGDAVRRHVQLSDTPQAHGLHEYRVVIPPLPSEVLTNNNACVLPVTVGADPTRLLLIEGRPRWEFRYLKNLFTGRDASVRMQYVLFHPDRIQDVPAPADRPASVTNAEEDVQATALPASNEEWMKFDVIVLGDVAPEDLGIQAQRALHAFVTTRGGSLVVVAGSLHMPHAYMGTPLADLLPVQCTPTEVPILTAPEAEFRMVPTTEGRESILMRLTDDAARNDEAWATIPPVRWRHALRSTKEGASVLAYALPADPPENLHLGRQETVPDEDTMARRRQFERENALVVMQHVAPGNVLFLATDNTWRLRYRRGDQFHHRFWGQVMRWATADRLAAGTLYARVGTDRPRYAADTPVRVRARLMSPDFSPIRGAPVSATVWDGDRKVLRRNLPYQADTPGLYAAELGTFAEGHYRIELDLSQVQGLPDTGSVIATEFAVTPEIASERVELSADRGLLARVAGLSGGQVFEPAALERVAERLGNPTVTRHERRQIDLWDSAWFFALLVAVAAAEWILRKKERLP